MINSIKGGCWILLLSCFLFQSVDGRRYSSNREFKAEDTKEIVGLLCYLHARFVLHDSPTDARTKGENCQISQYTKSINNIIEKKKIITEDFIGEVAGDSCYYLSQAAGSSRGRSLEAETNCEQSLYIPYVFQLYREGKITPQKRVIKEAAGDSCYYFTKMWNYFGWVRYTQRTPEALREDCETSSYVDYVYDLVDKGEWKPPSGTMLQEILRDICFYSSKVMGLNLEKALENRESCQNSSYLPVLYKLLQKKNSISYEVIREGAEDICYNWQLYKHNRSPRQARKHSKKCGRSKGVSLTHGLIQLVLVDVFGWEEDMVEDYDY